MVFGLLVLLDCYRVTLSILSGIALWRRERYAVKLTELYLLSIPVVHFIAQQLLSPWKPSQAYDPSWVLVHVAGPLLWVLYLERSERVRNTFRRLDRDPTMAAGGTSKGTSDPSDAR
jgi:hypothetical protein